MIATVATATVVSFVVASALLKFGRGQDDADTEVADDTVTTMGNDLLATPGASAAAGVRTINGGDVKRLVIACDAGMGSSVMVASQMKKRLAPYGVEVTHTPVDSIPADAQVVLTQDGLVNRAVAAAPHAVVVPFANYMGDPAFDRVEKAVKERRLLSPTGLGEPTGAPHTSADPEASAAPKKRKKTLDAGVLPKGNVRLGLTARDKEDAIRQAGAVLVSGGAADPGYIDGMLARELQTSTFLGAGVAIPHGTNARPVRTSSPQPWGSCSSPTASIGTVRRPTSSSRSLLTATSTSASCPLSRLPWPTRPSLRSCAPSRAWTRFSTC